MARIVVVKQRRPVVVQIRQGLPGLSGESTSKGEIEEERIRAEAAENAKLAKAGNLAELTSAATGRSNLGLGTAATASTAAFDAAGAAGTAEAASKAYTDTAKASLKAEITTEKERAEAKEAEAVKLTGNQSVAGIKTFTLSPVVPSPTEAAQALNKEYFDANAVKLTGAQTVAGVKTFSSSPAVPSPTAATDAASKEYVDSLVQGASPKESVALATTAALLANSYSLGVLTATANGALTVDGTAVSAGQRILVKNEAAEANNGIYTVTAAGGAAEKYVLTRSKDLEKGSQIPGAYTFVESGTENSSAGYVVVGKGPFTVGTTAIKWTQFTGAGEINAGTGLTKTGNTLSVTANTYDPFGAATTEETRAKAAEKTEKEARESADNERLRKAENLADLTSASTARTNLGLGSAATASSTEFANATTTTTELAARLRKSENLKDVEDVGESRLNLRVPMLASVVAVSTTNIASKTGLPTVDGITLENEDMVLLAGQTEAKENGPWVVKEGAWERPKDFKTGFELKSRQVLVLKGSKKNAMSIWALNTTKFITIGTTNQEWLRVAGKRIFRETKVWLDPPGLTTENVVTDGPEITVAEGEEQFLVRVSYRCKEGTFKFSLKKNGVKISAFEKLEGTSTIGHTEGSVEVKTGDIIELEVEASTGCKGRKVEFAVDHWS